MNRLSLSMSNVLMGTVDSSSDVPAIGDQYRAVGGHVERLVVLRGQDGIDALTGPAAGGSGRSRWVRRLYRAFDTIMAYIVVALSMTWRMGAQSSSFGRTNPAMPRRKGDDCNDWERFIFITRDTGVDRTRHGAGASGGVDAERHLKSAAESLLPG